ncbi:MAG: proline hydroxylase [Oscillatoriales cyanobacterium SM2_1_8]|nr:proline hydroxylase [Oscillatoriales cyanobacterium SM2_1_8]
MGADGALAARLQAQKPPFQMPWRHFELVHMGFQGGTAYWRIALPAPNGPPSIPANLSPQTVPAVFPSQVLRIENFLSPAVNRALYAYALNQERSFVPTQNSAGDDDYRRSHYLPSFPEYGEMMKKQVAAAVPTVLQRLEMPAWSVDYIEIQLTAHNDGNYYKIHNDNGSPDAASRELTYVYYFHREPKPFAGGELRVYDSRIENGFYVAADSFQTIEPQNNAIVFFLSRYLHEVLPVRCPSQGFADSRFTLNGWIRKTN